MAASAPKTAKTLGGQTVLPAQASYGHPVTPINVDTLEQQILQLQNTVNELITRHNTLCTDTAHAGDAVTGAGTAASNLFTAS